MLCRDGGHENLIEILRHSWFLDLSYYYIDMELCTYNLEDYLRNTETVRLSESTSSAIVKQRVELALLQRKFPHASTTELARTVVLQGGFLDVLEIFGQVTKGMEFIHSR